MNIRTQFIAIGNKKNNNIHEDNVGVDRIPPFLKAYGFYSILTYIYMDNNIDSALICIDKSCNFFGITLHYENKEFALKLAEKIKELIPNAIIFVGSIFATFAAKEIIEHYDAIDFVIMGHGEIPLKSLYLDLYKNNLSLNDALKNALHICSKHKLAAQACYPDINLLALPERTYLKGGSKTVACIIGSHGCYGKCSFCIFHEPGAKVSERNVSEIFREIEKIHLESKISFFYFLDSAIEGFGPKGKERLKQFCLLIINSKYKLSFRAFVRAESFQNNKSEDIELLALMKKAGFVNLFVGVESGNDNDLKLYNKLCTFSKNQNCLILFEKMNYRIILGYIILNPYTKYDDLKKNYDFLKGTDFSLLINYINCLQVNYNTALHHKLTNDGLLSRHFTFKSSEYSYICQDERTQMIFEFLKENFLETEFYQNEFRFNNSIQHIYYMLNILEDVTEIRIEVDNIRKIINLLCKDFFKIVFLDLDFTKALIEIKSFKNSLLAQYRLIDSINNKLLKKYLAKIYFEK